MHTFPYCRLTPNVLWLTGSLLVLCTSAEINISTDEFAAWKAEIEHQIISLQKENMEIRETNKIFSTKVGRLEDKMKEMEADRNRMSKIIECQNEELRNLHKNVDNRDDVKKEENENDPKMLDRRTNDDRNEGQGAQISRIIPGTSESLQEPVIFHSYLSSNSPPNLGTHHVIAFDAIPINKGNGYHHDNGIFEAPRPGTYVFLWTINTYPRGYIRTELVVNGNVISSGVTDSHADDGIMSGTNVAIADLVTGDHVYVRLRHTAINYIYSNAEGRSTFSGWLLH
ncbi:uncharacterized protein LOC128181700 [Crassostrea angulata]|uniref:uncharacterized protein LOC128181700 n=1 Tax=Magallana angulata TaxID=2784310 RepID=UPI0022B1AE73|nr:uncharacterized protein LOC128181700 [Crassostrea angulata]